MRKPMIIVLAVAILLIAFVVFYFSVPKKDYDVAVNVVELSSATTKSKLFLKKKNWGMTGDGQFIIISDNGEKNFELDSSRNYVFKGLSALYYKIENDTLSIYVAKASPVPSNLKTSFVIKQTELENPDMMRLIENDNYKKQGLKIIE